MRKKRMPSVASLTIWSDFIAIFLVKELCGFDMDILALSEHERRLLIVVLLNVFATLLCHPIVTSAAIGFLISVLLDNNVSSLEIKPSHLGQHCLQRPNNQPTSCDCIKLHCSNELVFVSSRPRPRPLSLQFTRSTTLSGDV